jgi:hypothetical protein
MSIQIKNTKRLEPLVKKKYINKLSIMGKFIYYLHIAKFWKDGDVASFQWNLWNPLSWVFIILEFILTIILYGISGLKDFRGLQLKLTRIKMIRWKPKNNEKFFYIDVFSAYTIESSTWDDTSKIDNDMYKIYNCFKTKKDANYKLKFIKEIMRS